MREGKFPQSRPRINTVYMYIQRLFNWCAYRTLGRLFLLLRCCFDDHSCYSLRLCTLRPVSHLALLSVVAVVGDRRCGTSVSLATARYCNRWPTTVRSYNNIIWYWGGGEGVTAPIRRKEKRSKTYPPVVYSFCLILLLSSDSSVLRSTPNKLQQIG